MSRQEVRTSVKDWIAAAAITNLNQVLTSFPKLLDFEINASAGQSSRAAGIVFIARESEERASIGGAYNGWKRIDYTVAFIINMASTLDSAEAVMTDYDTVIDAVKVKLRAGGHRLGLASGDIIFQAAENISGTYGIPTTDNDGVTEIEAALEFTVTQFINA